MGLFGDKDVIAGAALGASIGSGKKRTMEDSLKLGATIAGLENSKKK